MKELIPMDTYGVFADGLKSVYVVESDHGCKIGVTQSPDKRISQILVGSPVKYRRTWFSEPCSNAFAIESLAHKHFGSLKNHGEWFSTSFDSAVCFLENQTAEKESKDEGVHQFSTEWYLRIFYPEILEFISNAGFHVFDSESGPYLEGDNGIMSFELFNSIAFANAHSGNA